MKQIIRILTAVSFFFVNSSLALASPVNPGVIRATQQVADLTKNISTYADLLKMLEGKIDAKSLDYARMQIKHPEKMKISIRQTGDNKLFVESGKTKTNIEFLGYIDGSDKNFSFNINSKDFELDSRLNFEEGLTRLNLIMPTQNAWMNLLLPQAYADDSGGGMFANIVPMLVIGLMAFAFLSPPRPNYPPPPYAYGYASIQQPAYYGAPQYSPAIYQQPTAPAAPVAPLVLPPHTAL